MQTIKTAAIVVLMMTVMYSAYISLTTPPEPLPDDVRDLVINDQGTLAINANLPESLGALGINTGTPSDSMSSPAESFGSLELPASIGASQNTNGFVAGAATDLPQATSASTSLDASVGLPVAADIVAAEIPGETGITTRLSDMDPSPVNTSPAANSLAINSLAEPSPSLSTPAMSDVATKAPSYPSTNQTFQIPDPNQVTSSFGRTSNANEIPKTNLVPTDLALASGNADPSMTDRPAVSQTTALDTRDVVPPRSQGPNTGLANALRLADKQYAEDKPEDALATLSIFYNTPNLSGEERAELLSRLDPLARDVIYSPRHLLEQPHRVGQNETLMEIAARYEVPWQLLANINQVRDPVTILPGTELKVVRGPFRAEVSLSMNELTLFLGDHYAGRFPIGVGVDPAPKPGTFTIQEKQTERTYYNRSGSPIPPGNPGNPYGNVWLDLGGQLCIHGSPNASSPTDKGCISLAADFADDLYGILSQGSSVTIRR